MEISSKEVWLTVVFIIKLIVNFLFFLELFRVRVGIIQGIVKVGVFNLKINKAKQLFWTVLYADIKIMKVNHTVK